ncbi:hypothetical protein [Nocardia nova]|uniref:hypothetical protein n=1 Tax=Nocardia nova TaxID=37330 RepID=UPI0007A4B67E|nr:hypothetical protein [Nocardia nova]
MSYFATLEIDYAGWVAGWCCLVFRTWVWEDLVSAGFWWEVGVASRQTLSRVVAPTAVTAVMTTALAVAVNYATGGDHSVWTWVAVAALTGGVFAASLWLQRGQSVPGAAQEPLVGVDLQNVRAGKALRVKGVRGSGAGVRARRVRSGGDMSFEDIDTGHGGA